MAMMRALVSGRIAFARPPHPLPRAFLIALTASASLAAVASLAALASLAAPIGTAFAGERSELRVGSKRFTESYILAEVAVSTARRAGVAATHEQGLGGTALVFRALEEGSIDAYPEYTGTLAEAVLGTPGASDLPSLRQALRPRGIAITEPLGFGDAYALAVSSRVAAERHLQTLSDLARATDLRLGLSPEFMGRSDGFPGLAARYGMSTAHAQALDHGLAYEAIARSAIDVMDVYSTDAKIQRYGLVVLRDDRGFFPSYDAVLLYREDLARRSPQSVAALASLVGAIDAPTMISLNAAAELEGRTFASIADDFVRRRLGIPAQAAEHRRSLLGGILETVRDEGGRHLSLVVIALLGAIMVGVPLGVLAHRVRRLGSALLGATGIVQTIPSLALLCFFIPVLGTGRPPALAALLLYGLLPIARNTTAGLDSIPIALRESAEALGLGPWARLVRVELPLASRTILAGIRTSAVIAVGTATLAAFIGAGGFGAPISTGLNLNDTNLILEGAIPAAALALAVEGLFALFDRMLIPRGLRLR